MAKSKAASLGEYAALRFLCALVNALPYALAMALARGLARLLFDGFGVQRRRTLQRLETVFPEKSPEERRAIALASFANVLEVGVEMIRAPKLDGKRMSRYFVDGPKYAAKLKSYLDEGRGAVIMVPHSGNWYMAAWAMAHYGVPLCALAARQRNPYINDWMGRQYGSIEVIDRDDRNALVTIKARLASGRGFAILPDLRVRNPDVEVDFLRGKANVSHAPALFAVRAGAPIVVAAMCREKGRHVMTHIATLRPDPAAPDAHVEAARLTREALKLLGDFVLAHPGDWFWYNKRWILEPVVKGKQ